MRVNWNTFLLSLVALNIVETSSQSANRLRSTKKTGDIGDFATSTSLNQEDGSDADRELEEQLFMKSFPKSLAPSPHSLVAPNPSPTLKTTPKPTPKPTNKPTEKPVEKPSKHPSYQPTEKPVKKPSKHPSYQPTEKPSKHPSYKPSLSPKDCCELPEGDREKKLLDIYKTVSNPNDILTIGTPQNKAFNYILEDEEYCLCPNNTSCELVQRYVMAVYYFSTGGDNWVNCGVKSSVCDPSGTINPLSGETTSGCFAGSSARWLTPVSSCNWCGNVCEDVNNTCITQIDLESINQSGTLPFELQNITYLYYLSNEDGQISSTIPSQLGNIANLSFVDLNFQSLTGTVPENLYLLPNMSTIDLNDNKLVGSIPNSICNLEKLSFVQLGNEETTGNSFLGTTIPSCISSLQNLAILDVKNLGLTGTLPKLPSDLAFLDVANNTLTGGLSTTPWDTLTNLRFLVVTNNSMTGTIPSTIGAIPDLRLASFYNNDFTGSMPQQICDLRQNDLENLEADCLGNPSQLSCSCCTFCST